MAITNIAKEGFNNEIEEGLKLVDFWAPWCGSCKMINPSIESLADDYEGELGILKVNADEEPELTESLNVMSLPTILVFKDGEQVDSFSGFRPKEAIIEIIERHKG